MLSPFPDAPLAEVFGEPGRPIEQGADNEGCMGMPLPGVWGCPPIQILLWAGIGEKKIASWESFSTLVQAISELL